VFDIKISAQRRNAYTKLSQNELAMQFFGMGFFHPEKAKQALLCLQMMDFDGKDTVMQTIMENVLSNEAPPEVGMTVPKPVSVDRARQLANTAPSL
jgi:hypothetical protein